MGQYPVRFPFDAERVRGESVRKEVDVAARIFLGMSRKYLRKIQKKNPSSFLIRVGEDLKTKVGTSGYFLSEIARPW